MQGLLSYMNIPLSISWNFLLYTLPLLRHWKYALSTTWMQVFHWIYFIILLNTPWKFWHGNLDRSSVLKVRPFDNLFEHGVLLITFLSSLTCPGSSKSIQSAVCETWQIRPSDNQDTHKISWFSSISSLASPWFQLNTLIRSWDIVGMPLWQSVWTLCPWI